MKMAPSICKPVSFIVSTLAEGKNVMLSKTLSEGTRKAQKFPKNYKGFACGELQLAESDIHAKSCASCGFVCFTVTL